MIEDAFAGIPNLTIEYYDVSGRTPQEIRASINAVRPSDANDGRRVDGLARWQLRWSWRTTGRACDLSEPQIDFSATILMPRLVDKETVAPRVLTRWRTYIAALERHEAGHVRRPFERGNEIAAAIRASTCEGVAEAAQRAYQDIARPDVEYDRATRHGATEGAIFP